MMTPENQHITETLASLKEALQQIPEQYAKAKRASNNQIDALCEEAGIMSKVETLRDQLEATQKKLQTQADFIQGKVKALEELFYQYHYAPIPEGMTHMYGIELEPLDPETRLRVMGGDPDVPGWLEAIEVLGGDPDRKDWDGTEEIEEPVDVIVNPTRLVPPAASYVEDENFIIPEDDADEDTGDHDPNLEAIRNMMGGSSE